MRALVSGAAGFVGQHLVAHLRAEGDDVIGWDRADGGPDLLDSIGVSRLISDIAPDVIYHLAGDADIGSSWLHPVATFQANAVGTLHVLEAARSTPVQRVLCVGSADMYGKVSESELPLAESAPLRPFTPYAASKIAAEALAHQAYLGHELGVIRVRPFNHLGPGQRPDFVAPAIARRIARNEVDGGDVVEVGNLSPRRDFTDVRDVVRAYRLAVQKGEAGAAYNVCSGKDLAIHELADALLAMAKRPMRLESSPTLQRPVDVPVLRGDNTLLATTTGWQPEIPLQTTLADLLTEARAVVASA